MKSIICAVAFAATLATQATADVEADLDYLISQQVNRTMFEGALIAQRPLLVGAIENELRKRGMSVSDIERFLDIFMEEFIDEFTETMQDEARSMYKETFSEQEITDIAAFLRTPSGQAMVAATPSLMADGARRGQIAGVEAGNNAAPRVLRRIREEGITFDNPALIDQMIDEFDI
ncbi:DUF2059 domain-containing protein [Tateyamaria sp. ANG-S1]|uniref:DUF2059 domain-containing protein n=1 Tax=Tateyamaria sp. ANG-S1 TaxID=1577905 RepID=UPI00057E1472|nr:DUF2059 domain-containing protein [Tateyamaria sp. ANG-S1]KIC50125.1 hypothetical protein RA29_11110 [Tateyamaria sp. ANG-S1]